MKGRSNPSNQNSLKNSGNAIFSAEYSDGRTPSPWPASQQGDLFGPGAAPASLIARPASGKATRTSATSGPLGFGSLKRAALSWSLASRLRRRLDTVGSTMFSQTWKELATPAGRSYWGHIASALRTSGNGSTGWPLPRTADTGNESWETKRARNSRHLAEGRNDGKGVGGMTLPMAAQEAGWPSPKANNSTGAGTRGEGGENLATAAGWASPSATTWGGSAEAHLERKRKAIAKGAKMGMVVSCLDQQAEMAGWATPAARDFKSEAASEEFNQERFDHPRGKPLSAQALGPTASGSPAGTEKRGQLSPALSCWLMGFHVNWILAAMGIPKRKRK